MFKFYGIYHKEEDLWFNVNMYEWIYDLDGECLFPTFEMAYNFMQETVQESLARVYEVTIPQKEMNYEYSPVKRSV